MRLAPLPELIGSLRLETRKHESSPCLNFTKSLVNAPERPVLLAERRRRTHATGDENDR